MCWSWSDNHHPCNGGRWECIGTRDLLHIVRTKQHVVRERWIAIRPMDHVYREWGKWHCTKGVVTQSRTGSIIRWMAVLEWEEAQEPLRHDRYRWVGWFFLILIFFRGQKTTFFPKSFPSHAFLLSELHSLDQLMVPSYFQLQWGAFRVSHLTWMTGCCSKKRHWCW